MIHKQISEKNIDQNFLFKNNENIMIDFEKKISKLIYDISWKSKSIYRELFAFELNDLTFDKLKKRIIFLLINIITFEIIDKNQNLEVFISIKENNQKQMINNLNPINFHLPLIIYLRYKKTTNYQFEIIFGWINKLLLKENLFPDDFDLIDYTINKFKQINKKMFYRFPNVKTYNLSNYLTGIIQNISSKFRIIDGTHLYNKDLKTTNCYVAINYEDKFAFDAEFLEDSTIIGKINPEIKTIERKSYNKFNVEKLHLTNKEKIIDVWKEITKTLRKNFISLWTKDDKLYILLKTVKHLFEILGNKNIENILAINTSKNINIDLGKLFKIKKYHSDIYEGLDFLWIINSYNFKIEISNFEYNIGQIIHSNYKLIDKIMEKLQNTISQLENNQKNHNYLEILINNCISSFSYNFQVKYIHLNNKSNFQIFINEINLCNGFYDWNQKKLFLEKK